MVMLWGGSLASPAIRGEIVVFQDPDKGRTKALVQIIHETPTGDLLVESQDGRQKLLLSRQIVSREKSAEPFQPFTRDELSAALLDEYPSGFAIHETKNYLILHSTSEAFAKDAGKLLEKLKSVFENYMRQQAGMQPVEPGQPMIAVIFGTQPEYVRQMERTLGPAARQTAGVYVPQDNRLYLFDMLGGRDARWFGRASAASSKSADEIALLLATDTISTIIHEGVHQVAFNTGFHDRYVRQPLWLVEGLATLLEVPDLDAKNRWAGVGQINWDRAEELKRDWSRVGPDSLQDLVAEDNALRIAGSSNEAYAQAWGLSYYLTKARKSEYRDFVARVNRRERWAEYSPEDRLKDFEASFGQSPARMAPEFRRFIEKSVFRRSRPVRSGGAP
jgi:hypothetical protein